MGVFSPGYNGIGANGISFLSALTRGTDEGKVVKISDNGTVALCSQTDQFCGVVKTIDKADKVAVVQTKGIVTVSYSGTAPSVGRATLEADDAGYLDDVVSCRADGALEVRQVKYSTREDDDEGALSWGMLLAQRTGRSGRLLPSLLQRWAESLDRLSSAGQVREAALVTNREPSKDFASALGPDGHIDLDLVQEETRQEVAARLGGAPEARSFLSRFCFHLNRPSLEALEEGAFEASLGL